MSIFATDIISWYQNNKRDLPWRDTNNPYRIWLSEIILQQTRVEQGRAYYEKFVKAFPDVYALANASQNEVLNLWQGLGYYSRARNLHAAAQQIVDEYGGEFPDTYKGIQKLKGVGPYTAAAIASFAFNRRVPVVDGNVFRFLSRYSKVKTPINSSKAFQEFFELAQELMGEAPPAEFNQAIMEAGALICKPKNPQCMFCPVQSRCEAYAAGEQLLYPRKNKKTKVQKRNLYYFVLEASNGLVLNLRDKKGIWQNMYEFPVIESEGPLEKGELLKKAVEAGYIQDENTPLTQIGEERIHKLSHRELHATFYQVKTKGNRSGLVEFKALKKYPLPRLIDRFIEEEKPEYYLQSE